MKIQSLDEFHPIHINVRMNADKPQDKPIIELIHIPAQGTVVIEDDLWLKAVKVMTTAHGFKDEQVEIQGVDMGKKKKAYSTVRMHTGKVTQVNPVLDLITQGRMRILEDVRNSMTRAETAAAVIEANKFLTIPKEISDEELASLYAKEIGTTVTIEG